MKANKLIVTEEGFTYSVNGTEISIVCAKNKARERVIYVFQFQDKDGKGIGQSFTSKKLPNEEDKKRDNKIIEVIGTKIGLDREEAEKIISDLIESFNALPLEEKEKLKTKEAEPKKLLNAVELFDLVGEAFEGVSVFNEPVLCYNRGIVYEHKIPRQNSKSGAQSYRTEYNLYAMKLSKYVTSNVNYPFAVVTPGHVVLSEGEIEIYKRPSIELLKNKSPLNSPVCHEGAFRSVLINEFRMEGEEGEGRDKIPLTAAEIWDNFLKSGRIFELTTPVPLEELKNVKNIDAVLELAITDGLKKDTTLVTLMLAQIPKPDTSELEPDQYMPYAPNSIAITKTKTGKTTTAQRLSKNVVNRPTVANLLGFSTAEDTHVGELDCQMDTCFVDEITENADENVSGGLLSYLETGITKTARGHGITVRGHAPMVFMGNPKIEGTTDYDLLEYLRNIINQMTNNPQALGSRLGFLIFDNNMDRVTGLAFDREISKKSLMVLRTLQEAYRGQFSALFKDREVLKWLNTPFEDWYLNSLTEAENKSSLNQVKEFIRGLKDAYKHVRGTALHITFVESYEVLLTNGNLNIQEFLKGCDYWYQYLLAHTGGKGLHLHVFFNTQIPLQDDVIKGIKTYQLDVGNAVRSFLLKWILDGSRVDDEKILKLDHAKIAWDSDRKGSMIKLFGCQHYDNEGKLIEGATKTVIEEIPKEKPAPGSLPLVFPEKIGLWNLTDMRNEIVKLLESKIEENERNQAAMQIARLKRLTTPHISSRRKCLGFQRAEVGVSEGIRDFVCAGLICACMKWLKMSMDECMTFMYEWNARCRPSFSQKTIDYKIGRIYSLGITYSPCGFFKKAGLCADSKCGVCKGT